MFEVGAGVNVSHVGVGVEVRVLVGARLMALVSSISNLWKIALGYDIRLSGLLDRTGRRMQ